MYDYRWGKHFKRLIIHVLTMALILGSGFTATTTYADNAAEGQGAKFTDIQDHWAREQILNWSGKGLVTGYSDGTFGPERGVTRAEFIAFVNRAYCLSTKAGTSFSDVSPQDWFADEVAKAVAAGYISGYDDDTMRPAVEISRLEAAVILYKLLRLGSPDNESWSAGFSDAGAIAAWGREYVNSVVAGGYFSGYPDGTFKPDRVISRAETVALLSKAVGTLYNAQGTYGPEEGSETVAGNVTVSVSGVKLQNLVIEGDLILTAGIGDGDFEADGVVVKGRTIVGGGGDESVVFNNTSLEEVIVYVVDGKVRVVARGDTEIENILLQSGAHLQEDDLTGDGFSNVQVLVLKPGESIELEGDFERVSIETAVDVSVTGNTRIGELEVSEDAEGTNIDTEDDTVIEDLTLNGAAEVTGQGTIKTANINTDDYNFEKEPEKKVVDGEEVKEEKKSSGGGGGGTTRRASSYKFSYDMTEEIFEGEEVVIDVTFATNVKGDFGYEGVRFKFHKTSGPGNATFVATDSNGNPYIATNEGYWGPGSGFNVPAEYNATTPWKVTFSEAGTYTFTVSLVYASTDQVVGGITTTVTIEVLKPVTSLNVSADAIGVITAEEFSWPVKVQGKIAPDDYEDRVRFYAVISGLDANDIELHAISGGTPGIVNSETEKGYAKAQDGDLVLAWGPSGGFPLGTYAGGDEGDYDHEGGRTTNFSATVNTTGVFNVRFVFYNLTKSEQINDIEDSATITVTPVTFDVEGFDTVTTGKNGVSITVKAVADIIASDQLVRYRLTLTDSEGGGVQGAEAVSSAWNVKIETNENGIAYFGAKNHSEENGYLIEDEAMSGFPFGDIKTAAEGAGYKSDFILSGLADGEDYTLLIEMVEWDRAKNEAGFVLGSKTVGFDAVLPYSFSFDIPDAVIADLETTVNVTFANNTPPGDYGYEGVRFKFEKVDGPGEATFLAYDINDVPYQATDQGYWGPGSGFNIDATYTATTPWNVTFSEAGNYEFEVSLIEAPEGAVVDGISTIVEIEVLPQEVTITPVSGSSIEEGETITIAAEGADDLRIMLWAKELESIQAAKAAYADKVFSSRIADLQTGGMSIAEEDGVFTITINETLIQILEAGTKYSDEGAEENQYEWTSGDKTTWLITPETHGNIWSDYATWDGGKASETLCVFNLGVAI